MIDGGNVTESKRTDYMFRTPSVRERDAEPQSMRAEAIAMRRLVAERGAWLSPLLHDLPVPTLTPWERTADLSKLDHNHKHREERAAREAQASTDNRRGASWSNVSGTRPASYRVESLADIRERKRKQDAKRNRKRNKDAATASLPTEDDLREAERARCQARRDRDRAARYADKAAQQADAIARIAAVAAEKAAQEAKQAAAKLTPEQRAERRRETTARASAAYVERLKADHERHEKRKAERREADRKRRAAARAVREAEKAKLKQQIADAKAAKKAAAAHLAQVTAQIAEQKRAGRRKRSDARQAELERKRLPTAKQLVAEALAARDATRRCALPSE